MWVKLILKGIAVVVSIASLVVDIIEYLHK